MSLQQSFTWWSFAEHTSDPEGLLRRAAEIGYHGVEMLDKPLFEVAKDVGIEITTHRAHSSIEYGLNRREHHDGIQREVERTLELAERWNIPMLICFSGNRAGLSDEEGADITAAGLERLVPLAESTGVTLLLELLNSKVDHPDYQGDHTTWGLKIAQRVGSERIKLLYDVYHMQIMEGDLIRTLERHHGAFGHVHIAGNPGRHEPSDAQEIGYPAVLGALAASGYEGVVGHEYLPTRDPLASLQDAFALVQKATS